MTTLVYNPIFSPFRLTFTFAFILLACQAGFEITEISETRPVEVFPITTGTPHFAIDLDYPQAFELKILSFNGNDTQTGFCETFPSQITSKVVWSGPVNATNDQVEEDDTGLGESYSYDNIEFFNGYYFILDSLTFRITAIKDITDPSTYIAIESEFENQEEDQQLEDTYLILDPDISYLYIVTRKNLLYYPLTDFFDAVESNQPIPTIIDEAPNYRGYDMILSIRYYKKRLYIVADNIVDVYFLSDDGQITPQIQFDAEFFGAEEVSIADIAFRGNYSFVLDQFKGVYVVDITNQDLPHSSNLTDKFKFQQDETTGTQKGQFLEIIGDSLHIVSSGTRNPYIFEYIIVGDPILERLDFNRKIELYQSVRDTYTDSNFFFMITGFFNMVTKHSIPGRYFSSAVQDYLMEYWPVFGAKALVSQAGNKTSTVAVLHEDSFTVIIFEETNPSISCNTAGVKEGYYSFKLEAVQRDCPAKRDNIQADWNTVCEINQEIQLLMIKDSTDIGNVQESKETALYVVVGIGLMTLLVVVFCCLFRKYKKQHDHLEQKIKFKKLENEESKTRGTAEVDRKPTVDSEQEINPYTLNIQAELKKSEEKDRQKEVERQKRESPTKSPYKSPTKGAENERPPNAEIGDMKPLDMDEIYGTKGKPKDDSF